MAFNDPPLPKCWTLTVDSDTVFGEDNRLEIPGVGVSWLLNNNGSADLDVRFNDDEDATFVLKSGESLGFSYYDLTATVIDFQSVTSGASGCSVEIIVGVIKGE